MGRHLDEYTVRFEPVGKKGTFDGPISILEAARAIGVGITSLCGGLGSCGRCRVRVQDGPVSEVSPTERKLLSDEELAAGYRLACRTVVQSDVTVYVPALSRPQEQRLQLTGREHKIEPCPPVRKVYLELPRPTLEDTRSDLRRIEDHLWSEHHLRLIKVDRAVLPLIGSVLREGHWRATVTLRGSELIHVEPGDAREQLFGIAVDLGSTKIAIYLVNLATGETVEARGVMNPQIAYGEDVVSRLSYAHEHADGARQLQEVVVEAIDQSIASLCTDHALSPSDILELSLVGNTAMHHLFLVLPTEQLARSPFVPIAVRALEVKARDLGLHIAPGGYVYLPPGVAGFVGSDHVAMLLASRLHLRDGIHLGIDIGTNTEMSLVTGDHIRAVSCASGPAFEGAHINCGMKAAPGAIERVWLDPETHEVGYTTIGEGPPVGLCGSGILDCVAAMLSDGMLSARGGITPGSRGVRTNAEGRLELVVAEGDDQPSITVTQEDVERIQLAKGAIRSGIDVLMDASGITPEQVDSVVLAGAFGTYIDPLSALQIGMFPPFDPECIVQVGNAAGVGAKEMLVSTAQRRAAEELAAQISYLELTVYPRYSRFFAYALRF